MNFFDFLKQFFTYWKNVLIVRHKWLWFTEWRCKKKNRLRVNCNDGGSEKCYPEKRSWPGYNREISQSERAKARSRILLLAGYESWAEANIADSFWPVARTWRHRAIIDDPNDLERKKEAKDKMSRLIMCGLNAANLEFNLAIVPRYEENHAEVAAASSAF